MALFRQNSVTSYRAEIRRHWARQAKLEERIRNELLKRKAFARKIWRYAADTPDCLRLVMWARDEYIDVRRQLKGPTL